MPDLIRYTLVQFNSVQQIISTVSIEQKNLKTLKRQHHNLSESANQISILQDDAHLYKLIPFQQKLEQNNLYPLKATQVEIFQVNVGKMCNQVCKHCHVDAGPDRKEIMTRETMKQCLEALRNNPSLKTVDLTGGNRVVNKAFMNYMEGKNSRGY